MDRAEPQSEPDRVAAPEAGAGGLRAYVINLERAVERRRWMAGLLDGLGLPYDMVRAVDIAADREQLDGAFDFHDGSTATDMEMICTLSHMTAWERFLATGAPAALFLEDDVHFAPGFMAVLGGLEIDPEEEAIWRLETQLATVTADRRPRQQAGLAALYAIHTNHAGAAAYVLSRAMARRLVAQRRRFRLVIDTELFDPARSTIAPIVVLQCVPAPCIQDFKLFSVPSQPYLASILGTDRHDIHTGRMRDPPAPIRLLKTAMRPLYRALLSSLLALKGRRRIYVRYG